MAEKNENYPFGNKYKFKSIKVYSSPEWMYGATKKYRQVFDRMETDYIRAEFAFYNKLFDEQDWDATVTMKAFDITDGKRVEICSQDEKISVKTDQNIVNIYKGWGMDGLGAFWKKGDYIWEAYIDGVCIGSEKFFVEDIGRVTQENNPYFDVVSLRVYNGPYDGWNIENRKFLKKFKRDTALFVWSEITIKNKTNLDYNIELFMNFYDDAGQLKGQAITMDFIKKGNIEKIYVFQEGWGSKDGGSWQDEKYTVEIVFMDVLVAATAFEVGNEEIEGVNDLILGSDLKGRIQGNTVVSDSSSQEESLEDVMKGLESLIGLEHVKTKIKEHINYLNFINIRKEKGFVDEEKLSLHSVFTGNPGTGKTTVVKMLGKIYKKMGLLSNGVVKEVDRADLVGEYIGQTAPKVRKALDEAKGGILFVDEAYMLYRSQDDPKDFGKEVIEVLVKEMSEGKGDIAIMVAGYPSEMDVFLNSNPGLKSRFNFYFHFEDYTPEELMQIANFACEKRSVKLADPARKILSEVIMESYRNRDKSFGNARYVYSLIDEGKMNLGLRLMKHPEIKELPNEVLETIEQEDIEKIISHKARKTIDIPIDEPLLKDSLAELNSLVGLSVIKSDINELVKLVRYYRETGKDVLNKFSLHTVFKGNPGTGKTTVARIIGKIYKALGLLERGHVVETDREGLVAGYVGQTAIKTKHLIDEATNGVLFIDEAYGLAEGSDKNSFGQEAIQIILKNMEDLRGHLAVVVAGYPDNMEEFLKSNPGLRSRFDRTLVFDDYTPEQLFSIAQYLLSKEGITANEEAENHLKIYLDALYKARDKFFGNARSVRQIVEKAIKNQHLRMASLSQAERTKENMMVLAMDDVKEFKPENIKPIGRATIGFKTTS